MNIYIYIYMHSINLPDAFEWSMNMPFLHISTTAPLFSDASCLKPQRSAWVMVASSSEWLRPMPGPWQLPNIGGKREEKVRKTWGTPQFVVKI